MKRTKLAPRGMAVLVCTALLQLGSLYNPTTAVAQLPSFTRTYQDLDNQAQRDFNNSNMITTPYYGGASADKGYLIANNVDDGDGHVLVRLTAVAPDGSQSWSHTYGEWKADTRCFALAFDARDKGYLLTGYKHNFTTNRDDLWLLKIDENGTPFHEFSFNTDSIPCTIQGGLALCRSFYSPNFYGMDILQIEHDSNAREKGEFAVVGFVSEKESVLEPHTLKRNFVWRFYIPTIHDIIVRPDPRTRYLKVFHGQGTGNNQPTDQDLANEIQELPNYGLMLIGHSKGSVPFGPRPSPRDGVMFPYYTLMRYDGGGTTQVSSLMFNYAFMTTDHTKKNVRTLLGKDDLVYMLGYYQPKLAFTITPLKPLTGSQGTTMMYYTDQDNNVPAFSFYQSKHNSDNLVVMGYQLGYDAAAQQDYVHPYDIIVSKGGGALTNFNRERMRSPNYNGYSPADPVLGLDYFKPFEKYFPPVTLPEIGILNHHLGYEDAEVAGVLYNELTGTGRKTYHTTLSQFQDVKEKAECHPDDPKVYEDKLPLEYKEISFNIDLTRFRITRYTTNVRKTEPYYKCDEIPEYRGVAGTNSTQALQQAADEFQLFPNPATDMLQIRAAAGVRYTYNVTTVTGMKVYSGSFEQKAEIAVGNWANGVYMISFSGSNGNTRTFRFVKQ